MISRRRFLEGGSRAGFGATAGKLAADDVSGKAADSALPPSIAALSSRKSEAVPITRGERSRRQERARQLMNENSLDAIVLMEGTSLENFTGIDWWDGERLF